MDQNILANIIEEKKKEMENIFGMMVLDIKVNGKIIKSTEKLNNKGTYLWKDGRSYVGKWKDNCMNGYGVYSWKDGRKYEGEYSMDKKHGKGTYSWNDGRKLIGYWNQGKQEGECIYITEDGKQKKGVWENGKRIKWIDNTDQSFKTLEEKILESKETS